MQKFSSATSTRYCTKFSVSVTAFFFYYTGCFIMYSGITKSYYRKTLGHVFTKPVQTQGKTKKNPQ